MVKDIKRISIYAAKVQKTCDIDDSKNNSFISEILCHSSVLHHAIVRFIGYNPKYLHKINRLTIFMENNNNIINGNIDSFLLKSQTKLNDTNKLIIIYGIAHCMSCLHENKILHRDLNICFQNSVISDMPNKMMTMIKKQKFLEQKDLFLRKFTENIRIQNQVMFMRLPLLFT